MGAPSSAVYQQRKAEGRCVECAGQMLPEWVGRVRCPECNETNNLRTAKYRRTKNGREVTHQLYLARKATPQYAARLKAKAAQVKAKRLAKKLAGLCTWCNAPALEDNGYCATHRAYHLAKDSERRKLQRRGLKKPDARRVRRLRAVPLPVTPAVDTRPAGGPPKHARRDAVIAAVARFDSISAGDLAEVLGCSDIDSTAYAALCQMLSRLARAGLLERIGTHTHYAYRAPAKRRAA
jgi:hypothetical protein